MVICRLLLRIFSLLSINRYLKGVSVATNLQNMEGIHQQLYQSVWLSWKLSMTNSVLLPLMLACHGIEAARDERNCLFGTFL